MNILTCYIEHANMKVDQSYIYQFKEEAIQVGMRIWVNFAHARCVAFVDSVTLNYQGSFDYEIKMIEGVIDETPILNQESIELASYMAKTTLSPYISCLQAMLPSALKPKRSFASIKLEKWVRVEKDECATEKQKTAYQALALQDMSKSEWLKLYKSVATTLIKNGCVVEYEKESVAKDEDIQIKAPLALTADQKVAVNKILHPSHPILCLHGVTGSGKTEVYLQSAKEVLNQGKQVCILVPEISLTPLMVSRVKERFGNQVAIYHSHLNDQERYEQYQSIANHQKQIVVGTRSAIFMPFDNLGLIIMDEEHDLSYKQDSMPRYHARDIAIFKAKRHQATLLLASATPSLETYARATKGVYGLVELPQRISNHLPSVKLINMAQRQKKGDHYILSKPLIQAIGDRLNKQEQVILLLNRRGYQPILRCSSCSSVLSCPHCDRSLVYHKQTQRCVCHLCGYETNVPTICPSCKEGSLKGSGIGTQLLAETLQNIFPKARLIRMDADTTQKKNAHQQLLGAFERHEADILLGTQMIAKGLDFENVTLVGILQGDAYLYRSDYRCGEMTFDLLCQASGRSGRGDKQGEVMIQVFDDEHYAIRCAIHHDYLRFFKQEMHYRHLANYPPYVYLCSLVYKSKNEEQAYDCALQAKQKLKDSFKVLGVAQLGKVNDEYRCRIIIKSKSQDDLEKAINQLYQQHRLSKQKVVLLIDMNPLVLE